MKINPLIFRTYDIRGIYPAELNEEIAYRVARAYSFLYPETKKIVVARDSRLSSPSLTEAVKEGFIESGKEVIDIGIAPDSLFYFSIFHYYFDGGIMISGSHNPKEYNGLTLHVRKRGKKISEDVIGTDLEKIKTMVFKETDLISKTVKKTGRIKKFNPSDDYTNYISDKITLQKSPKVVIDSGNGACGLLPEKVFKKLGCQVKTIYPEFDGTFPHHLPDPYLEDNLKDIKETMKKEEADIGFAFDGDGDRVAPIDNQIRFVEGDFCLLMLARQALRKRKGPIVHDMRVSKAFLDEMEKEGVKTYFSVSHHNAVIDKIIKVGAVFGGEVTLHFLFPLEHYLCDDALFAAVKIAEIASSQKDFALYVDSLPRYHTSPEIFIDCPDKEKFKIIKNLQKYLRANNYDFIDVDGARINFKNGWALARAANTTPIIKCRFEGDTRNDLVEVKKKSLEIFRKTGIPVTEKHYKELGLL